ncbi:MAG: CHAT domain-containing protein [Pseudonocardiaceae bacterium]
MPNGRDFSSIDRRMALAQEWDESVARIRKLLGFEDFFKSPTLDKLLTAASGGPVVIVNVSQRRCDALIVQERAVTPCPLPQLTGEEVVDRANGYLETLQSAETAADIHDEARRQRRERPGMAGRQAVQRAERALADAAVATEAMLTDLLGWLWDVIAEPVLTELKLNHAPGQGDTWPRVWWCPTGPLNLLPLHAAGRHGDLGDSSFRTVMDRVISSYTPTLRALLEARKPIDGAMIDNDRLLVVGLAESPGQRPLRGVAAELDVLAELVPEQRRTVLKGPAATRAAVQRELQTHRWVHLSCHGKQELDDPSGGGLALHDGVLSISDIATQRHYAEFAGLSACKTATGGINLLDEAITLAAALHYTGYRHVIGTLWSVYDSVGTADLWATVYRNMVVDGRLCPERSAEALHQATLALRDRHPHRPSTWTPFVHIGP